jgi:hypothetical protein
MGESGIFLRNSFFMVVFPPPRALAPRVARKRAVTRGESR